MGQGQQESMSAIQAIWNYVHSIYTPPPRLTVTEWAERFRFLSKEYNAKGGKFRLFTAPYQAEPMESINDDSVNSTTLMWGSQLGKTELLMNVVGYFVDSEPAPMLIVQPTIEMGESWSKERLAPTVRDTPVLREKVKDSKSRDSGNTILNKRFPGGNIAIAGANSPAGLASRPRRVVLLDEVDRFPASAGTEGDPCKLAERRTETFYNAVVVRTSTPTIKNASRIEEEYNKTDQRKWFVPCPKCKKSFCFEWSQVKWPDKKPEDARIECPHCEYRMTDKERLAAIKKGTWKPTAPFNGARGYFLNGIYSPFRHKRGYKNRLHQMVAEFLNSKGNRTTLQTWTNTFLAETWEEEAERMSGNVLLKRREKYGPELPDEVLCLTAGVDVQEDRLEVEIVGWGEGFESWGARYVVLPGSPLQPGVWDDLEELLTTKFQTVGGYALRVNAACIDSGGGKGTDTAVYKYTKPRSTRRIFAIKGSSSRGVPIASSKPSYTNRGRAPVYRVGTDEAKRWLFSSLKITEPGYNYLHFPENDEYDHRYFQMLTAEEQRVKIYKGRRVLEWHQIRQRNEALDCRVYARAALDILNPNWTQIRKNRTKPEKEKKPAKTYALKSRGEASMLPQKPQQQEPQTKEPTKRKKPRRQPRNAKNWATSL